MVGLENVFFFFEETISLSLNLPKILGIIVITLKEVI